MARFSDRWGLSILGPGDKISDRGYKFAAADIALVDRLLAYAVEQHRHTGLSAIDRTPDVGLNLTLETTGGTMPSGSRFFYRYTLVDPDGNESAGSPIVSIDTATAIIAPQAPSPVVVTGSGSLLPGRYTYVLSAYKNINTLESKAINSAAIAIPSTNASNSVQLTLPSLPLGATGFNVYRRAPSGMHYLYLDSVEPGGATPTTTWVDDGSIDGDCDRGLPSNNRTASENAVRITYPGATPTVPDGYSWRIYRTVTPADWGRSLLATIAPQGATPFTPTAMLDVGSGTQIGGPPSQAQVFSAPPKVDLTDAAEVQGTLPPGLVTVPVQLTFVESGPVTAGTGVFVWVCDFDMADIISVRAHLSPESTPAVDPVIVDVNAYRAGQATPAWQSIFGDGPSRPQVPAGETVGAASTPTAIHHLVLGDRLSVDVDQSGGGATPTDQDITVNILLYTKQGSETVSYTWSP